MTSLPVIVAIVIGFLGGVHCFGMCGGIVTALSVSIPPKRRFLWLLSYNFGRCFTYVLLGVLAGFVGQGGVAALGFGPTVLFAFANLMLIGMGLYLMGWPWLVQPLERAGHYVWRSIEPMGRRFVPMTSVASAWMVGLIWGFLPCGLVYSALVTAVASANPLTGGVWMAGFALGTLPNLMLAGWLGAGFLSRLRQSSVRWIAGTLVAGWGVYGLFRWIQG